MSQTSQEKNFQTQGDTWFYCPDLGYRNFKPLKNCKSKNPPPSDAQVQVQSPKVLILLWKTLM
jgi:hypothetical protein